jgi:hypothetical protein
MRYPSKSIISFVLLLTIYMTSGPSAILAQQLLCQPSGTPITQTGTIGAGDTTQSGRTVRDGIPSTCMGKINGLQNSTAVRRDAYNFTAPVTGCATVDMDMTGCGGATANSTEVVAYSPYNPAAPGTGIIGDPGFSTIGTGSFSFPVTNGQAFTIVVHEITVGGGCASYKFDLSYSTACRQAGYDRTNDGKADPTIFRPTTGIWSSLNSAGGTSTEVFGSTGDIPVQGDFTGDGQTDVAVFRPSNSFWYSGNNHTNPGTNFTSNKFGTTNDVPVKADFDRDGKNDLVVWRPSDGNWYILFSTDNTFDFFPWGKNGDTPISGDFDGDRIADFAIVRPEGAQWRWFVLESNFGFGFQLSPLFGLTSDKVVPADYDGDGKTDVAIWRPSDGTWWFNGSFSNVVQMKGPWGKTGDIPQPADYDGDKISDIAVFRPDADPANNFWYIQRSSDSGLTAVEWGQNGDVPVTAQYVSP